ncbi:MAG: hypothetical protein ACYC5S_05500 [Thiobacillus sp.]
MNAKIDLPSAISAWNTDAFAATLKQEIEALGAAALGLDQCLTGFGNIDEAITVIVLGMDGQGEIIETRIIILFTVTETIYRCPDCSGDDVVQGACEMTVRIDRSDATAVFAVTPDP